MENVEWGVDDGDGWRLLCGGSNVGVGNEPSDGALGVVYGGDCSGGVDVGDGAICWGPCGGGGGLEMLWEGGGWVYMAGSICIGVCDVTSAYVRSSVCGWLRLVSCPGARAAALRAEARR